MAQRFIARDSIAQGFIARDFTLPDSSEYPLRRNGNIIFPPRRSKMSAISPQTQ